MQIQGIVYRFDGSVKGAYTVPSQADLLAQVEAGEVAYEVPLGTLDTLPYDLTALKDQKKQQINEVAGVTESERASVIANIDAAETIPEIFAATAAFLAG